MYGLFCNLVLRKICRCWLYYCFKQIWHYFFLSHLPYYAMYMIYTLFICDMYIIYNASGSHITHCTWFCLLYTVLSINYYTSFTDECTWRLLLWLELMKFTITHYYHHHDYVHSVSVHDNEYCMNYRINLLNASVNIFALYSAG